MLSTKGKLDYGSWLKRSPADRSFNMFYLINSFSVQPMLAFFINTASSIKSLRSIETQLKIFWQQPGKLVVAVGFAGNWFRHEVTNRDFVHVSAGYCNLIGQKFLKNVMPFYSLKDYLPEAIATGFFELSHDEQVQYVEKYLHYLQDKPLPSSKSSKQSIAYATLQANRLPELTQSGFGAQGTPSPYLNQLEWSMKVARFCGEIQHEYVVEQRSKPVLNSRSFYFYWCHAEKQLYLALRNQTYDWNDLILHVDRPMCPDCIAFFQHAANYDRRTICVQDPEEIRVFRNGQTLEK